MPEAGPRGSASFAYVVGDKFSMRGNQYTRCSKSLRMRILAKGGEKTDQAGENLPQQHVLPAKPICSYPTDHLGMTLSAPLKDMTKTNQTHQQAIVDGYVGKPEIAHRLNRTPRSIEKWMRQGRLPFLKIGRAVLFHWPTVEKHLNDTYQHCPRPKAGPPRRKHKDARRTMSTLFDRDAACGIAASYHRERSQNSILTKSAKDTNHETETKPGGSGTPTPASGEPTARNANVDLAKKDTCKLEPNTSKELLHENS